LFVETPDGNLTSFTLPSIPALGALQVIWNGLILSTPLNFSIMGNVVTFAIPPGPGDLVFAYY
jgi:hypothetical protein